MSTPTARDRAAELARLYLQACRTRETPYLDIESRIESAIHAAEAEARREAIEEAVRAVDAWAVGWRKGTLDYANGVKHRIECENKVEEIERYVDAVRRLLSDTPAPPREPTPMTNTKEP